MPKVGHRPVDFYDDLAAVYDRLYPDWEVACREQGDTLDELLCRHLGPGPHRILDAAVGIGTQVLGLAVHGHELYGTDVSPGAVRRARAECAQRRVDAAIGMADMRALPFAGGSFDAVVCVDNAIAHLMSADGVTAALRELRRVTRSHGLVVVTTRDYDQARQTHPPGTLPQVWSRPDGQTTVTFQVWAWRADGQRYDLQHFQLIGDGQEWRVAQRTACYWAVTREELLDCADRAGFATARWLLPAESGFFQPALIGQVHT
jgi:ubiquinone/menaquinone biosynthesis C-methylase UbiE